MELTRLFTPITIGGVTIPNRFVVPPMGNNFANTDGSLSEHSAHYYAQRAAGGFGLITIEATVIEPTAKGGPRKPCLYDASTVESFRAVAEQCHRYGAKVSVQLQHAGPEGNAAYTGFPLKAASAIAADCHHPVPEAVTTAELEQLITAYGNAAANAQKAGLDFVELHLAHGYFLHSFLSPRTNHRTDHYGGCLENRLRLIRRILSEIRQRTANRLPILCRINACDDIPGGLSLQDSLVIAAELEDMGVDALHVSRSVHLHDETMWATGLTSPAFSESVFRAFKETVSIPIIAVGRFTEPAYAELMLRRNSADCIAFGRQSIADPSLPKKAREQRLSEVSFCVGCLQGCVRRMMRGKPITCMVNPAVGDGKPLQPAKEAKNILIVGGGPAGLMAAKMCAQRGHSVQLWEKEAALGGQLRAAAVPPGKGGFSIFLSTLIAQCEKAGVQFHCGRAATTENLQQAEADLILLAIGSRQRKLPDALTGGAALVSAEEVLLGKVHCGERVAIIGGGLVGCETAAFLAERQHFVTILEQQDCLMQDAVPEHRKELVRLLQQGAVTIHTNTAVQGIQSDSICYTDASGIPQKTTFDTIIYAIGNEARQLPIRTDIPVLLLGDAKAPGNALAAIEEGYILGTTI